MKQAMNFRLSPQVVSILLMLKKKSHTSNTKIIEEALLFYAQKKLPAPHPLSSLVGKLSEKDADKMLLSIRTNRRNKQRDIKL